MVVSNDDFLVAFVLNVKNTVVYLKKKEFVIWMLISLQKPRHFLNSQILRAR
jgi:hypothetical protein